MTRRLSIQNSSITFGGRMPVRSATSYAGGTFPAFPLGGPTKIVEVTERWTALLAGSSTDYVLLDVPEGTKMVISMSSTEALEGTLATIDQSRASMRWRPGYYEFCVDRDGSGPVVYVAIDPSDGSDDADRAEVRVTEAAT